MTKLVRMSEIDAKHAAGHDLFAVDESGVFDSNISNVAAKYRGTDADARDMAVLGKKQVLRRNFGFLTMLGFASTCIASWEGVLS